MAKYSDISTAQADGVLHYWDLNDVSLTITDLVSGWNGSVSITEIGDRPSSSVEAGDAILAALLGKGLDTGANIPASPSLDEYYYLTPVYLPARSSASSLTTFSARCVFYHRRIIYPASSLFPAVFYIGYQIKCYFGPDGVLYVQVPNNQFIVTASALPEDAWYDIVVTCDGADINLYINGALIGSMPEAITLDLSSGQSFFGDNSSSTYNERTDGIFDELTLWDRALSATEISNLYSGGSIEAVVAGAPVPEAIEIPIEIDVLRPVLEIPVTIEVEPATTTGSYSLPLAIQVSGPEAVALPVEISVYSASEYPGNGGTATGSTFAVQVYVGGQDYTSRLIGSIEVDAEEGSARVANFAMVLSDGAFEPDDWINLPVVINYIQAGASFRIFSGIVDLPELSLEDNSVVLSCTDNLQGRFENKPRSVIESIFQGTGSRWSPAVFGEYETSYQFAEDLLSTIPASADLDRNGQLVFSPWYAPGYDFIFSDAETFPESISAEWGSRRDIVTQVNIDAEYSYQFFRERKHRYFWEYPRSFGEYLEDNTSLPSSSMIEQAANADGWSILGKVAYERLPESGEYDLPSGGTTNWSISDDVRSSLAVAADFTIRKRWVQDVRETYAITVKTQANIDRFGLLAEDVRVTLDTSIDETGFEDFENEPASTPVTIGSDTAWPTFEKSSIDAALETAVAKGKSIIQESLRQNTVSFTTLIQPELERYHFIRLESASVIAHGKCSRVRHVIDLEGGSAVTDVEIAIFRGDAAAGSSLNYSGLDYSEAAVATFTLLYTKLQDYSGTVPEPGDGFQGYVGNYVSQLTNVPNPFEERFSILAPAISSDSRDSVEHSEAIYIEAETFSQTMTVNL